jgi:glycosyltransferase involved in cell wall biosynthesis
MPEVSVVIPTRNRWPLLSRRALPAALAQVDVDQEVIVVDDGSTDEARTLLAEIHDPRVRVIRHETRAGVARARNTGIAEAQAAWVAFLDDDDVWSPRKLRVQLDASSSRDADFVYSAIAKVGEDARITELPPAPSPPNLAADLLSRNVLRGGCSNVMAKTKILRSLGGFDERLFQLADWDLWIRLATAGVAAVSAEITVACFDHRESMVVTSKDDIFQEFEYLATKHRELGVSRGVAFDRPLFTRWVALGRMRAGQRARAARLFMQVAREERDASDLLRALAALAGPRGIALARRIAGRHVQPTELSSAELGWLSSFLRRRPEERANELEREMADRSI